MSAVRTKRRRDGDDSRKQAHSVMRIPEDERRNALLVELIDAIVRNGKIDTDGLYSWVLGQLIREDGVARVVDEVRWWCEWSERVKKGLKDQSTMKRAEALIRQAMSERRANPVRFDPFSVVDDLRRGIEVNCHDLAQQAPGEGNYLSLFGELEPLLKAIVREQMGESGPVALEEHMAGIQRVFLRRTIDMPAAHLFNERFLNGEGIEALAISLGFQLMSLDPEEFSRGVGGEMQDVLYGSRPRQIQKRLGPYFKSLLDRRYEMVPITPKAVRRAAKRYAVYQYPSKRNMKKYKTNMQLCGKKPRVSSMCEWFREFDDALGIERRGPGRPPKEEGRRAT